MAREEARDPSRRGEAVGDPAVQGRRRRTVFGGGLRIGSIAGTEILIDGSILIIFVLVLASLGLGVFPAWHPTWPTGLVWLVASSAALLFFLSVLVHEMAHALTARMFGTKVPRITLFLFGGMAQMEQENSSPGAEFLVAIAGPLTSILIGVLSLFGASFISSVSLEVAPTSPEQFLASLGPVTTLLMWLGPINILLAVFNLLPGFPLDGGRVLRALLWWTTGNVERATRWASGVGQVFAWLLMGVGIMMAFGLRVPFLGSGVFGGLWLVLIGWFLNSAARMSYDQFAMLRALEDVPIANVMRSNVMWVTPDLRVDLLVRNYIMNSEQRAFPVVSQSDSDTIVGLVTLEDVRKVAHTEWEQTPVSAIMTPAEKLVVMQPEAQANDALRMLANQNIDQIPVVEAGRLVGIVRRKDIMKWLALRAEATS